MDGIMTPQEFVCLNKETKIRDEMFNHEEHVADFAFDEDVTRVFPDMIGRSVPGYWQIVDGIGLLSKRFIQPKTVVYDLGTSLGAVAWSVYQNTSHPVIAVDVSQAMISQFAKNLDALEKIVAITPVLADVLDYSLPSDISFCTLNFTLQFIPVEKRKPLLQKIYHSLTDQGALVLSEKLHFSNVEEESRIRTWHHDWKHQQGYSRQEIEQKSKSISKIMPTESLETHVQRLKSVGFQHITLWYQTYSFVSLVAEK
jgi:tRNA (cmo5U34)-methyltransferase